MTYISTIDTPRGSEKVDVVYSCNLETDAMAQRAIMTENGCDWYVGTISHQFPMNPAHVETTFNADEVEDIATKIMAGNQDVLRTKGLARKLSAYVLLKLDKEGLMALRPLKEQQHYAGVRHEDIVK